MVLQAEKKVYAESFQYSQGGIPFGQGFCPAKWGQATVDILTGMETWSLSYNWQIVNRSRTADYRLWIISKSNMEASQNGLKKLLTKCTEMQPPWRERLCESIFFGMFGHSSKTMRHDICILPYFVSKSCTNDTHGKFLPNASTLTDAFITSAPGAPVEANAGIKYTYGTKQGAMLIARPPITCSRITSGEDDVIKWVNENIDNLIPRETTNKPYVNIMKRVFWVIRKTYYAPQSAKTAFKGGPRGFSACWGESS